MWSAGAVCAAGAPRSSGVLSRQGQLVIRRAAHAQCRVPRILRGSTTVPMGRLRGSPWQENDQHEVVTPQVLRQAPCAETASVRPAATTSTTPLETCCRSSPWSFWRHVVRQPVDPWRTAVVVVFLLADAQTLTRRAGCATATLASCRASSARMTAIALASCSLITSRPGSSARPLMSCSPWSRSRPCAPSALPLATVR